MKTKALLLAVLFGSALAVSAQKYEPQVGFSTERGSKTNFKKNKATDNVFISLAGGANVLFGDLNGNADLMDRVALGRYLRGQVVQPVPRIPSASERW